MDCNDAADSGFAAIDNLFMDKDFLEKVFMAYPFFKTHTFFLYKAGIRIIEANHSTKENIEIHVGIKIVEGLTVLLTAILKHIGFYITYLNFIMAFSETEAKREDVFFLFDFYDVSLFYMYILSSISIENAYSALRLLA